MNNLEILHNISEYARDFPARLAYKNGDACMTYEELDSFSDGIARMLQEMYPDDKTPVVIFGHKDPLMIASFIGCAKSGRAYCPVDISMPQERITDIVSLSGTKIVLLPEKSYTGGTDFLTDKGAALVDRSTIKRAAESMGEKPDAGKSVSPDDIFYIIFTSGSTGKPKGVQIPYRCLNSFAAWSSELGSTAAEKSGARFLNQAPFSFDLSVMDLYTCLACGGTLYPLEKAVQNSYSALFERLHEADPEVWVSTPSFAEICLAEPGFNGEELPGLRIFLFCGERLTNTTAGRLIARFPQAKVINTYGPTESTVAVTDVVVTEEMCGRTEALSVGRPKPGCRIYICSEGSEVPEGEPGEIVITGDTLSTGYFKNEEQTKKAFRTFRTEDGRDIPAYYTGDEGYMRDGLLYFNGRLDLQIKLHGYRIELGDIENNLLRIPYVSAACVVPNMKEGRVTSLTAAVCAGQTEGKNDRVRAKELKETLREFLPDYMVPKKVVFMDRLPMTANGKTDRRKVRELCG